MKFCENLAPNGQTGLKAKVSKVCGKEGAGIAIRDHIEANHLEGLILSFYIQLSLCSILNLLNHFHERSVPFLQCLWKGVQVKNVVEEA